MASFKSTSFYRSVVRSLHPILVKHPDGPIAIERMGHRNYVGGYWEEIGLSQFLFLLGRGLKPHHIFLDLGCGAFRSGVHFMEYLKSGNYLGLEKESLLIERGICDELGKENFAKYQPEIVVSSTFEFSRFKKQPDFVLAHSVFTHLPTSGIVECLKKLREFVSTDCVVFATFFIGNSKFNLEKPCDHYSFYYSASEIVELCKESGWEGELISDWHHPADQKMFTLKPRL